MPSVEPVWFDPYTRAVVFLGAEEAITPAFLLENEVGRVITVNDDTLTIFHTVHNARTQGATLAHDFLPFLDDWGQKQSPGQERNAAQAVEVLVEAIQNGERVVVHCRAGLHRSPAVVYNALLRLGYFENAYEAYCVVQRHRPRAQFVKSLVRWVRKMHRQHFPWEVPAADEDGVAA